MFKTKLKLKKTLKTNKRLVFNKKFTKNSKKLEKTSNFNSNVGKFNKLKLNRRKFNKNIKNINNKNDINNKLYFSSSKKLEFEKSTNELKSKLSPKINKDEEVDVVIVGGGHNGLVTANYLAKYKNLKIKVIEKRDVVGGACVNEEIVPGFKFSRGAYLSGLFSTQIIEDLDLGKYGLSFLVRNPSSFTPGIKSDSDYLLLGEDEKLNETQLHKYNSQDGVAYKKWERSLDVISDCIKPFLDHHPIQRYPEEYIGRDSINAAVAAKHLGNLQDDTTTLYKFFTMSAKQLLGEYFKTDIIQATLATDAVIGSQLDPEAPGSAYVLLHHVMGNLHGRGEWLYTEGGMGKITEALAHSAIDRGVDVHVNTGVKKIVTDLNGAKGVLLDNGHVIKSKIVVSNADPYTTYNKLLDDGYTGEMKKNSGLGQDDTGAFDIFNVQEHMEKYDFTCGAAKINVALNGLPSFTNLPGNEYGQLHGTIHLVNEMKQLTEAAKDANAGKPSTRPVVEMTIPSVLDSTLAPDGKHVANLFVSYVPYDLKNGSWSDPKFKKQWVDNVFNLVEEYAPGFKKQVIDYDALTPLDIETTFGMHKGNIFHGSMNPAQLYFMRPHQDYCDYRTPIDNLYNCGAGNHPGGGVMGHAGKNAAAVIEFEMAHDGLIKLDTVLPSIEPTVESENQFTFAETFKGIYNGGVKGAQVLATKIQNKGKFQIQEGKKIRGQTVHVPRDIQDDESLDIQGFSGGH